MTEKKPWSRFSPEDTAEAVRLYEEGRTIRVIAEWLGRPVASIHQLLLRKGVTMRPRGGPAK